MSDFQSKFDALSNFHLDALREIGNIGAGHAAVALTQFLNRSTYMSIPNVVVGKLTDITNYLKCPSAQDVAIISTTTTSDLLYTLVMFLNDQSVVKIIDLAIESKLSFTKLNEMSPLFMSLIKETGSILLLKYVEALNFFLHSNSFPTPPLLRIGMVSLLKENELKEIKETSSSFLLIQCDIFTTANKIQADLVIIPHEKTFDKFMSALLEQE